MLQLQLVEHEKIASLSSGIPKRVVGGLLIAQEDFAALKKKLLAADDRDDDIGGLLKPCMWRNTEALQARNYAGVILLPSGLCLEILPKICLAEDDGSAERTRAILLKMLRTLPDSPFRTFEQAILASSKVPLLEIFIACFLHEVGSLIRRGICSDYVAIEGNRSFLRGKLLLHEHLRRNAARQERLYVRYDEFLPDRPENRLVKSALIQVARWSNNGENQRRCQIHCQAFADVPTSKDVAMDLANCRSDRNLQHYKTALSWCRLLLQEQSPVPQAGIHRCLSVLFPMEKLFERYVAVRLREKTASLGWRTTEQAQCHHLVEHHNGHPFYALRPDILFSKQNRRVVADTKWKCISSAEDIKKQGDLYQLFAYGEKYLSTDENRLSFLIYPQTEIFRRPLPAFFFRQRDAGLHAVPYDLETDECAILELMEHQAAS